MNGQHNELIENRSDQQETRFIHLDLALKTGRDSGIEFWHDNGDGTCTRVEDGLTLSYERYNALEPPHRYQREIRQHRARLRWDD